MRAAGSGPSCNTRPWIAAGRRLFWLIELKIRNKIWQILYGPRPETTVLAHNQLRLSISGGVPSKPEAKTTNGRPGCISQTARNPRQYLVPGGGLEPPRPCGRRILSPLRLPIPPSRQVGFFSRASFSGCQQSFPAGCATAVLHARCPASARLPCGLPAHLIAVHPLWTCHWALSPTPPPL